MIFCCKIIKFVHVAQWIERSPPERKAVGSTPIMYIHLQRQCYCRCFLFYQKLMCNISLNPQYPA